MKEMLETTATQRMIELSKQFEKFVALKPSELPYDVTRRKQDADSVPDLDRPDIADLI